MKNVSASRSIQREYRRLIWAPFCKAVDTYRLIRPGDRIAVCYSGGKDSSLLACCVRDYQAYSGVDFTYEILMLDPGYEESVRETALRNAESLGFSPTVVEAPIFEAVEEAPRSFCHVCAAMRRGYLYKNAGKLGCGKIALGHHLDDVAETTLMSVLYGGQFRGMMPYVPSDSHPGMALIRPLCLVREKDVIEWSKSMELRPITCACRMTRKEEGGARKKTKALLKHLEEETPNVVSNIFASLNRVSLDTVLRYRLDQNSPWVDRLAEQLHFESDSAIMNEEIRR